MIDTYIAAILLNLNIMLMMWAYDAKCYGRSFVSQVKYDFECYPLSVKLIAAGLLFIPLSMAYVCYKNYSED